MYPKSPFLRNPLVESQLIKRNPSDLNELLAWLCETPTITTYRVNLLHTTVAAFRSRLEQLLGTRYADPPRVYEIPAIPEVLCVERLQQAAPRPATALREVIVDSCCSAALLRGAHIYAPGVLAMMSGTRLDEEVQVFGDLAGRCKKGTCTLYDAPEKLFVGTGVVRMQRYQLYAAAAPSGVAIEMRTNVAGVPTLGDLSSREALLQNLPSIVCVRVLDPQPHECILDMCAAPGNKTTHIAELMRDQGVIVAFDKTAAKVSHITERCARNGLASVQPFVCDATKSSVAADGSVPRPRERGAPAVAAAPPFAAGTFDRVLLDAPCSALGNRPVLTSSITPKMLLSYPQVQRRLFANAVQLLKPNGVLVYSTCTVTEEENECMVAWALSKFPQLRLAAAAPQFGGPGLPHSGLTDDQRQLVQRFGPASTNLDKTIDTVGFFIAKFIKSVPQ